jgi:uncharacterized protein (DUF2237 family)
MVRDHSELGSCYGGGVAAPVVLAATHEAVLQIVPMAMLREHAVDVPDDPSAL